MHHFKRLAMSLPVKRLLESLESQPHLWDEITARQTTPGSPHSDTRAIFLRWAKSQTLDAVFNEIEAVDYPAFNKLPEALELIEEVATRVGAREIGRVMLVELAPGGRITEHVDEGAYADHYERFHVSLQSDDGNAFFVRYLGETETVHMEEGEAWYFDHKKTHTVFNLSNRPRIHLIIDAVAPDYRRERDAISA